ncbi:hypothetical protein [Thermocrinis sp.]
MRQLVELSYLTNQDVGQDCGEVVRAEAVESSKVVSWEAGRWVSGFSL